MKKTLFLLAALLATAAVLAAEPVVIRIGTAETDLILKTAPSGRLLQSYLGAKLADASDIESIPAKALRSGTGQGWEVYPGSGAEDYFEPALAMHHNDGNLTTILTYVSHDVQKIDDNTTHTIIRLEDKVYPVQVALHYMTFDKENIIKSWSEISHREKKPVVMDLYASSMLYFCRPAYYLTEFSGEWAKEMQMSTQQLQFGKKVLDTKLGSRAGMHTSPYFLLGLGSEAAEQGGEVVAGAIAWTGNFRFNFEIDHKGNLRVISGINPYASQYELQPGQVFLTPEFIFTYSNDGIGKASRSLHDWARRYQLKDGMGDRMTLLNNWEATYFDFDTKILSDLMVDARELGVDLFLLDDGWFANKYPRANDKAGLGDWQETKGKLEGGIPALVAAAKKAGVKFGIWIEPEMVNPKSELFEKHPDWVIKLPNRETYYFRNQLVLDLSNPAVQDFVFGVVDGIMQKNPEVAYMKWDCNSPITNIYSPYLKEKQNHLYIEHARGLHNVFRRVQEKYPDLTMMLCSGGGARCDYDALQYFTEFWCSDNTDPVERIYIQWGFSQFLPAKAMAAHVTDWNKSASIKFRVDVAMMCKLGFDIKLKELSSQDFQFCQQAVADYNRLKGTILDGDMYRLVSPYETNHTAVLSVDKAASNAVLFAYDLFPRFDENIYPVKLQGLDPARKYRVTEINVMPGEKTKLAENGKVYSGDYLMKVGIDAFRTSKMASRVIEIKAE